MVFDAAVGRGVLEQDSAEILGFEIDRIDRAHLEFDPECVCARSQHSERLWVTVRRRKEAALAASCDRNAHPERGCTGCTNRGFRECCAGSPAERPHPSNPSRCTTGPRDFQRRSRAAFRAIETRRAASLRDRSIPAAHRGGSPRARCCRRVRRGPRNRGAGASRQSRRRSGRCGGARRRRPVRVMRPEIQLGGACCFRRFVRRSPGSSILSRAHPNESGGRVEEREGRGRGSHSSGPVGGSRTKFFERGVLAIGRCGEQGIGRAIQLRESRRNTSSGDAPSESPSPVSNPLTAWASASHTPSGFSMPLTRSSRGMTWVMMTAICSGVTSRAVRPEDFRARRIVPRAATNSNRDSDTNDSPHEYLRTIAPATQHFSSGPYGTCFSLATERRRGRFLAARWGGSSVSAIRDKSASISPPTPGFSLLVRVSPPYQVGGRTPVAPIRSDRALRVRSSRRFPRDGIGPSALDHEWLEVV